jgi:hypothetical protein
MKRTGTKPKKKKSLSNKAQYERFIEAARQLEVDENPETFERVFKKIVPPKFRSKGRN